MAPENVGLAHRAIEAKARLFTVQALAAGTVMQTGTQKGLAPVKYAMDTVASRFTVQAFATGMLSAFGHNPTIAIRDYDGEIQFAPDSVENASVRVTVRTSAMEVVDEMKNDDRKKLEQAMYEQVLEVDALSDGGVREQADHRPEAEQRAVASARHRAN